MLLKMIFLQEIEMNSNSLYFILSIKAKKIHHESKT